MQRAAAQQGFVRTVTFDVDQSMSNDGTGSGATNTGTATNTNTTSTIGSVGVPADFGV